jgi:hypothetical protein
MIILYLNYRILYPKRDKFGFSNKILLDFLHFLNRTKKLFYKYLLANVLKRIEC